MSINKEIEYISVDELAFDPDNPRLPSTLRDKKNSQDYEQTVIDWMLENENVMELMGSIGEKGFFPAEPLLVVLSNGKYEVVEGNRRLTAVKLLNNPDLATRKKKSVVEIAEEAKEKTNEIPSLIFDEREEILAYLGYKHITGVEAWDSLAKAKYLKQLLQTLPPDKDFYDNCKTLAKIIGSKASYVRLLLIGVDIYNTVEQQNFFGIDNLGEENFEFGVFYTALGRSNISKYVGIDLDLSNPIENVNIDSLEDLTKWIYENQPGGGTKLGESRNLSKLDKILDENYPKALKAFKDENKSLDEAARLTDHPSEIFQNSLNDSLYMIETARNYAHEVDNPNEMHLETLKQIFQISRDMVKLIQAKITNLDDVQ